MKSAQVSPEPFAGSVKKVDRAQEHLRKLTGEWKSFVEADPGPYRVGSKVDVESSRFLMHLLIERQPPTEWSLIIGDFIQNLRAALDHLVCHLIYAQGREPTSRHAFPIVDNAPPDPHRPEAWNGRVDGLDATTIAFIEGCQPYHGEDGPGKHVLAALRTLSNEDKHRLLLPAVASIGEPDNPVFDFYAIRDCEASERGTLYINRPLNNGDLILEAGITITGPDPTVGLEGEIPLTVAFGREPHIVPVKSLNQMLQLVGGIVAEAKERLAP